jgi:hypothetical protein
LHRQNLSPVSHIQSLPLNLSLPLSFCLSVCLSVSLSLSLTLKHTCIPPTHTHARTLHQDVEDASLNKQIAALSPALHADFTLRKDLPLQALEEKISAAIVLAKTERRLKDLKVLKEQKECMAYVSAGLTAEVMRERLIVLKQKLGERIDELMDADDDDGCIICDEYQTAIQRILDQDIPVASPSHRLLKLVCLLLLLFLLHL